MSIPTSRAWPSTFFASLVCASCFCAAPPIHLIPCLLHDLATSVDVERVFSRGRLVLSHVRNRLSAQSTRAILCVGAWSLLGLIKPEDSKKVAHLDDIDGDDDVEMEEGWDRIDSSTWS